MAHSTKQARLEATAYHEGGQAVVAFSLGIKLKNVSIIADADTHGQVRHSGRVAGDPTCGPVTDRMVRNIERQVMVALAGLESQRRCRRSSVRNYHTSSDYEGAVDLLAHISRDEREVELWIQLLLHRTKNMVSSPHYWPAIEHLAGLLMAKKVLAGGTAEAAIRRALNDGPGECSFDCG